MTESILTEVSQALFRSIAYASPLIGDLPEGDAFAQSALVVPGSAGSLNLRQKLGHLYEDALTSMLDASPAYNLEGRGIQIRREVGRTIGELDFLIRDLRTARLIHLELAVKFYLALENKNGFLLPGPDARDNYFRKLERMRSHQLILTEKFWELLPAAFKGQEIVVRQLVCGCVFDHINTGRPVEAEYLNPEGRRGKWLHAEECGNYFGKNADLKTIPKPLWPVPLEYLPKLEPWTACDEVERCLMVRAEGLEVPCFIVPNSYPV